MTEYDRGSILSIFLFFFFVHQTYFSHRSQGWVKKVIKGFLVISRVD